MCTHYHTSRNSAITHLTTPAQGTPRSWCPPGTPAVPPDGGTAGTPVEFELRLVAAIPKHAWHA